MHQEHGVPFAHEVTGAAGIPLRVWEFRAAEGVVDAPHVLFLHGYLDQGRSFDDLILSMKGSVHAWCLDWRGHGESRNAGPGASYHLMDHAKDLSLVLGGLPIPGGVPDAVVAHSMAVNVAMLVAGSWPELVKRLLLLDALGGLPEDPEAQPERLGRLFRSLGRVRKFRSVATREEAMERIMSANPGLSLAGAERMARHGLMADPDDASRWTFAMEPGLRGPTPMRWPQSMWLSLCGRIMAPVRLVRAERGYVPYPNPVVEARLGAFRDVEVVHVEGAHHHLHVDFMDVVVDALQALLLVEDGV